MDREYLSIVDVVKSDIEKVNDSLYFDFGLKEPLNTDLKEIFSIPSKRIRSLLIILDAKARGENVNHGFLSIIEILHNASLIHDDVIDESKLRRQKKTLNENFDNKLAVITGDYLLAIALKKINSFKSFDLIELFSDTLKNMCVGEVNQYFNRFKKQSIEEYIEKSKQKTGYLFMSALSGNSIINSGDKNSDAEEFALNFGIAFQIRDDLINILNKDSSKSAKDDEDGIYNAPFILSDDLGCGIEKTKDLLNNYVGKAYKYVANFRESKYKDALIKLLELIKNV